MTFAITSIDQMEYASDAEVQAAYVGGDPSGVAWLSGWNYRKSITLSRASGAVTNYQMKLLVGESSGASGYNVHLGCHGLSSFNDLRFTNSDGTTLLDYWIESVSGTTPNQLATVWIEFDAIGTSATTFYMYYGNSGASAASDGDNTFVFFDDFPGSSIDGNKWNADSGFASVSSGILTLTGNGSWRHLDSKTTVGSVNCAFRSYANIANGGAAGGGFGLDTYSTEAHRASIIPFSTPQFCSSGGGATTTVNTDITLGSWKIFDILVRGGVNSRWFENGVEKSGSPKTTNPPNSASMGIGADIQGNGQTIQVDWCFLRKYVSDGVEPAWGTWGIEYNYGAPIAYSESSIVENGSYSLKSIAYQDISLNKTLIRALGLPLDLSGKNNFKGFIQSSRTGSNIKIGLHDSGGTTTEVTPNITSADTWQLFDLDISGVSDANKDAIDQIIITIVNADADNTFYLDDFFAVTDPVLASSKIVGYAVLSPIQPALNVSKIVGYAVLAPYIAPVSSGRPFIFIF